MVSVYGNEQCSTKKLPSENCTGEKGTYKPFGDCGLIFQTDINI